MTASIDPRMAWLEQICDPSYEERPIVGQPWSITIAGEPWTVATDVHRMVCVRGHYGYATPDGEIEKRLRTWRAESYPRNASRGTIDLAALRGFLDAQRSVNSCPECQGRGALSCECECGHKHDAACWRCAGEGLGFMWLDRALFNASLIATPLRHLSAASAELLHDPTDTRRVAVIKAVDPADWIIAVMPLWIERVPEERKAVAPTFEIGEVQSGAAAE